MNRKLLAIGLMVLFCSGAMASAGAAQAPRGWEVDGLQLTRTELQDLLDNFEDASRSTTYSASLRERARFEADLIRSRLQDGDFQVGDQIALVVEGEAELSNTFMVRAGRILSLPKVGDIDMDGVLRAEVEEHLTRELGKFIRDPVVHARSHFRMTITGAVGRPGFYAAPADIQFTDALMLAGGPANGAKLTGIYITRGGERIWEARELQQAIIQGRTLDQLNLRAGDHIVVPTREPRLGWQGILGVVSSVVILFTALNR